MYKINKSKKFPEAFCVIRLGDMAAIPPDQANTDYQAYLKWLEEGNEPLPANETSEPSSDK